MPEQPAISRLVTWSGYLALCLLLILPLSVLTVRAGVWQQGLLMYALACLGAGLILCLCLVLRLWPRYAGQRKAVYKVAITTLPGCFLLLSLLGSGGSPPIHDISTDTEYPPAFTAVLALRDKTANSLELDAATMQQQQQAYPELATLSTPLKREAAFDRALDVAQEMGWEVVRQDREAGEIEAVATTAIMAFKDDIVIRLSQGNGAILVDLRSASRVGVSDMGANAKRIKGFQGRYSQ